MCVCTCVFASIYNPFFSSSLPNPITPQFHLIIQIYLSRGDEAEWMAKPMFQEDFPMKIECEWDLILFDFILFSSSKYLMQDSCVLRLSSDVILCASPLRRCLTPSSSRWKAKEMAIVDTDKHIHTQYYHRHHHHHLHPYSENFKMCCCCCC